jgi:glucokinase
MTVLGIDIGGHSIKAGTIDTAGKILARKTLLTEADKGRKAVVSNILNLVKHFLSKDRQIAGIGIGIPGIVDAKGLIRYTPNIPLSNFNLGKQLRKLFKGKLAFGNDADNFALAAYKFGAGKGRKTIIGLTLGTGVGSGIVINGTLFSNNGAPELGHTTIQFDGPRAECCGNDGCIESFIGRKHFSEDPQAIYKEAMAHDKDALKTFTLYGTYLGVAISNFVNIFNPDVIVLGGEISNAYNLFRKTMEKEIKKRSLFRTRVVKNKLKHAGILGSAVLAF